MRRNILIGMLCLMALRGYAAEPTESSKLHATRLQSVTVPTYLQEQCSKEFGAKLSSTYIYVVIASDGAPVWTSPKQKLMRNQTRFEWPDTPVSTAALLWEKGTPISIRVFLSDNEAQAVAGGVGVGATGGAGAGALIGGILAGWWNGGLGAPAGALIGAAIGGVSGGAVGGATGALSANDRVLFETEVLKGDTFPLDGTLEHAVESFGEKHTASIVFTLLESKAAATQGGLELGEKYIVRIRTIHLSERAALKGEKKTDKSRYYVVLQQGDTSYEFHKDEPFALPTDIDFKPSIITILKNTGQETKVQIFEDDNIGDDLVFSSSIGAVEGKGWAFIGRASPDDVNDTSYVEFDTFGPLK